MSDVVVLAYYSLLILLASLVGGMIPGWIRLTHRRMEFVVSFVAGTMLGIGLLHILAHALADGIAACRTSQTPPEAAIANLLLWVLVGFLVMFFIERFFCFHHHEADDESEFSQTADSEHAHCHHSLGHAHDLTWSGAAIGLSVHSILAGVALAASVAHHDGSKFLPGFGTFLVILLHKPFDSMTISALMQRGGWGKLSQEIVNALFALAIPAGVVAFHLGMMVEGQASAEADNLYFRACALAFSAGMFCCIAMSDLLPELQFHQHDRLKLSAALLLGLACAWGAAQLETSLGIKHTHEPPSIEDAIPAKTDQIGQ